MEQSFSSGGRAAAGDARDSMDEVRGPTEDAGERSADAAYRGSEAGARVLILRPEGQASRLRELLEARGARTTSVPVLEIVAPVSYAALDAALARVGEFDWVVLTSVNAADAVAARLPTGGRIRRLAVIGAATAVHVGGLSGLEPKLGPLLVPERAVSEALAEALAPFVRQLVREQGEARVLLPAAEQARDVLPRRLRAEGAEVTIAAAYRNGVPADSVGRLRALFARRELWPEVIPFTSSSSVTHLLAVLREAGRSLPEEILRVSIGPVTSATLREHGLVAHAEAAEATVESLAEAVMEVAGGVGVRVRG